MIIERNDLGEVVVLRVEGEMDIYNSHTIKESVQALITEGRNKVVANLSAVTYIDSSAIGSLISATVSLKNKGGGMKLCQPSEIVTRLFSLIALDGFFEIYETEPEALRMFKS